jgi:hypothetical protein
MSDVSAAAATASSAAPPGRSAWHDHKGFGFRDILDIVNPLQHLPVISSIYRWLTGDRPGEAAQIAGDALYGGPIGVAFGLLGAALQDDEGHDAGERVLAAVFDKGKSDTATAVAAAAPAPAPEAKAQAQAQASAPAETASVVPAAVVLDHPPMPLHPPVSAPQNQDAVHAFLERKATLDRQIAGPAAARGTPVPLIPPAGSLPEGRVSGAVAAPAVSAAPVDISQRMLDALDKYMRMEKEKKAGQPAPNVDYSM